MFNHSYKVFAGIILGVCSQAALAATSTSDFSRPSWFITASSGALWESAGENQTITLAPNVTKTYIANTPTKAIADSEVFFGLQRPLPHSLLSQFGVALVATGGAPMTGTIWEDGDPAFNNYTYNYKVSHTALLVQGKLIENWKWPIKPLISVGVGVGLNRSSNFNNAPLIDEAVATPNFTDNTTTAFTYNIAIGGQHQFNKNCSAGLSHEFSDWGRSELGQAPGQTQESGLSLKHLHTSSLLLNLIYTA
ncbi:MAG: porin family protein [Gammaproteobacteria bacterium]|nr:porin family protein [Gammaproteobacteria bacterium]